MNYQTAPQPAGYPCQDPDFGKPLPGSVTHWPDQPFLPSIPVPPGLLVDPWDAPARRNSYCHRNTLPVVQPFTVSGPPKRIY